MGEYYGRRRFENEKFAVENAICEVIFSLYSLTNGTDGDWYGVAMKWSRDWNPWYKFM